MIDKDVEFVSMQKGYIESYFKEKDSYNFYYTIKLFLPFRIPIKNGSTLLIKDKFFFLFLNQVNKHPISNSLPNPYYIYNTAVEITVNTTNNKNYITKKKSRKTRQDYQTSKIVQEAISTLNELLLSMSLSKQLMSVYPVTFYELVGSVIVKFYKRNNKKTIEQDKFILQHPFTEKVRSESLITISKKDYTDSIKNMINSKNNTSMSYKIFKKIIERNQLFYRERFNEVIVLSATIFEMLIVDFILKYKELDENYNEEQLKKLSETSFANLIDHHFFKIISPNKLDLPYHLVIKNIVLKYKCTCSQYRHDIVHRGLEYGMDEMIICMETLDDLMNLITSSILKAKSSKFIQEYSKYNSYFDAEDIPKIIDKYK
ncbi:hypothetical protein [Abyssicoccus albus]|uniref:hypothetical protein n=1 Tax=Abyssicoccus albus TaxID=1817405 RepID=UPI00097E3BEA|nr:hypothetical protein [Abyssicoccus albus]AQL56406.1 hypothetical protein BVH56_05470 [Abyssicoccus albus]